MGPELVFMSSHVEIYGIPSQAYGARVGLHGFPYGTQWESIWSLMGEIRF